MGLSTRLLLTAGLVAVFAVPTAAQRPAAADPTCRPGYVWRVAFTGDLVCVTPETRTQAAQDTSQANDRREPGGGASGPNTCRSGYVWREAAPDDVVCVTPEVRDQTRQDNAEAASRRVGPAGAGRGTIMMRPAQEPPVVAVRPAYRMSEWSPWSRAEGVQYRYRSGWNPQEPRYNTNVDAIYELKNVSGRQWIGAARSVDCSRGTLSMSSSVTLKPNETREVKFLTTNCGTRQAPYFRPDVVQSVRFD
jgi:hypothetical protein